MYMTCLNIGCFEKCQNFYWRIYLHLQVADTKWVTKDENKGLLKSEVCNDKCPNFCGSWETFNEGESQWEEDPTFTIKCKGWYLYV